MAWREAPPLGALQFKTMCAAAPLPRAFTCILAEWRVGERASFILARPLAVARSVSVGAIELCLQHLSHNFVIHAYTLCSLLFDTFCTSHCGTITYDSRCEYAYCLCVYVYIYIYIHFTRHGNRLGMQLTHVAPTRSSSNFLCAARRAAIVPWVATIVGVVHARVLSTLLFSVFSVPRAERRSSHGLQRLLVSCTPACCQHYYFMYRTQ